MLSGITREIIEKKLGLSIKEIQNMGHNEIDRHIAKIHGLDQLPIKKSHIGVLNSHNSALPAIDMEKIDKEINAFLKK